MSSWSKIDNYNIQFQLPLSYSHRSHKLCRLSNGLLTLLVSDPTDVSNVCSMTVATGSHNDPRGVPGIAHLCEHMLFAAGSKQYPDPNQYHTMLATNNGTHNAYTMGEQTTFYFELPIMHQDGQLEFDSLTDIFASFFKDPLFSTTVLNRELYAIQSEHDGNVSDVDKILYQGTRLLSNDQHPFHQFSTGDIQSLNKISGSNIKSMLSKYFKENFFAESMTLVIRGPQSVNILTKIAQSKFGDIKWRPIMKSKGKVKTLQRFDSMRSMSSILSTHSKVVESNILEPIWKSKYGQIRCFNYDKGHEPNFLFIKSTKQAILRLVFPVSSKNSRFSTREISIFSSIWCELFGDESEGSLCYNFLKLNWINECIAYKSTFATDEIGLILEFTLTEMGQDHIIDIINEFFNNAIDIFTKANTDQISRYLYEFTLIEYIKYLYKGKGTSSLDFCSELSECLQGKFDDMNLEFLFKLSCNMIELNTEQFENLLGVTPWWYGQGILFQNFLKEFINLKNLKMLCLGDGLMKSLDESLWKGKKMDFCTDPYFEFDYVKRRISLKRLLKTGSIKLTGKCCFMVPPSNKYIPSHIENIASLQQLFMECSLKSRFATLQMSMDLEGPITPRLVQKSMYYEMWVCSLGKNSPMDKSIITFQITSLSLPPNVNHSIHLEILAQVLDSMLSFKLYSSLQLGYSYEIKTSLEGEVSIGFTISGFNNGVYHIINEIIDSIQLIRQVSNVPSRETLRQARVAVRNQYMAASRDVCVKLASMGVLIMLERYMWSIETRLEALEDSDMIQFKLFVNKFFNNMNHLTLFVESGDDLTISDEVNFLIHNKLTHHLNGSRMGTPISPLVQAKFGKHLLSTIRLLPGTNDYIEYEGAQDDINNSIVQYIQTGSRRDSYVYTMTCFTEYLMSLTLVPELRQRRQIGYVVLGGKRVLVDMMGIHITVMSGSDPMDLEEKINEYLYVLERDVLGSLTQKRFKEQYVTPFLRMIEQSRDAHIDSGLSGPSNLLDEIASNVVHGSRDTLSDGKMKRHKRYLKQINHDDTTFPRDNDLIDRDVVVGLTLREYMKFFKEHISIKSIRRCKLSVMIKSPLSETDILNKQMYLQVETFLKMKGLTIKAGDLQTIVNKSNGSPGTLLKLLLRHFSSRGETWKLCSVIGRELGQSLRQSLVSTLSVNNATAPEQINRSSTSVVNPSEFASSLALHKLSSVNHYKNKTL